MDIYLIKWYDAFSVDKWHTESEMQEEMNNGLEIESFGFFFKENDRYITLIQNRANNDNLLGMICIPKNCIIEKTKL
jgi:hypothetical protein